MVIRTAVTSLVLPIANRYTGVHSCVVKHFPNLLFFSHFQCTFGNSHKVSLPSTVPTLFSDCRTQRIFHAMARMTATEKQTPCFVSLSMPPEFFGPFFLLWVSWLWESLAIWLTCLRGCSVACRLDTSIDQAICRRLSSLRSVSCKSRQQRLFKAHLFIMWFQIISSTLWNSQVFTRPRKHVTYASMPLVGPYRACQDGVAKKECSFSAQNTSSVWPLQYHLEFQRPFELHHPASVTGQHALRGMTAPTNAVWGILGLNISRPGNVEHPPKFLGCIPEKFLAF